MTVLERLRDCFETIESLRGSVFLPDIHKSCEAAKEVERLLRVHAKDFLALVEVCQQIDSDMRENCDNSMTDAAGALEGT